MKQTISSIKRAGRLPARRVALAFGVWVAGAAALVATVNSSAPPTPESAATITIEPPTGNIVSLGFSANGRLLTAGSPGSTPDADAVQIWDAARGTQLQSLPIASVVSAAISPDGNSIATVTLDSVRNNRWTYGIALWDVGTGIRTALLATENSSKLRYTNIVFADGGRLVAADQGGKIGIWNAATGALHQTIHGVPATAGRLLAVSPDGLTLAAASFGADTVTLWRVTDGVKVGSIKASNAASIAISAGSTLGVGGWSSSMRGAAELFALSGTPVAPTFSHQFPINLLNFSGDGQRLITAAVDGNLRHWNVADGDLLGTANIKSSSAPLGVATALAASADGRLAYAVVPGKVILAAEPYGDPDADFVISREDNCPWTANADQADGDADGRGDACDLPRELQAYFSVRGAFAAQSVQFDATGSSGPHAIVAYEWDVNGDGVFERTNAPVKIKATFDRPGMYQVRLRVTDDEGAQATYARDVMMLDAARPAPVAANETLAVDEDVPATGTLTAGDLAHRPLTYSLASLPAKGTVAVNAATGDYEYRPHLNAFGTDAFTFTASNGTASSNVATVAVTIAPVNDAPSVAAAPADVELGLGAPSKTIDLAGTFADVDLVNGDQLVVSAQSNNPAVIGASMNGKLLTLHCQQGATGTANVAVRATDSEGAYTETNVKVTVTPLTPSLIYPSANATGVTITRDFEWTRVAGADSYLLLLGTTPGGWDILAVRVAQPSYRVTAILPPGRTLYARVAATVAGVDHYGEPTPFTPVPMAPSLIYPTANATNVVVTRNFEWTPFAGADSYLLLLGTTPGGWDLLAVQVTGTSYRVNVTLPAGRTLYARVAARVGGVDRYGEPTPFTMSSMIPSITYPAANATNVVLSRPFEWTPVAGASSYLLLVGTTPGGWDVLAAQTSQPSYRIGVTLPAGRTLYARVAARINGVDHYGESVAFAVLNPAPAVTYPLANGTLEPGSPFEWTPVQGAESYLLLIGTTPFGWDQLAVRVTSPSYLATALPAGQTLYATVAAEIGGVAYYGDTSSFRLR